MTRGVIHFGSREAMDIEGLGEVAVEQLVEKNLIHNVADLYHLSGQKLLQLPLFAEKKSQNLLETINASKNRGLSRLLYGLGIRHVGQKVAIDLAEAFGSMQRLMQASQQELEGLPGIGPVVAETVAEFFHEPQTKMLVKKLESAGVLMTQQHRKGPQPFAGATFVLTGELSSMTRPEAEERIRLLGGKASSSVSKRTDYVVAGDNPGSKLEKARKFAVKVLDEGQFKKLIGE